VTIDAADSSQGRTDRLDHQAERAARPSGDHLAGRRPSPARPDLRESAGDDRPRARVDGRSAACRARIGLAAVTLGVGVRAGANQPGRRATNLDADAAADRTADCATSGHRARRAPVDDQPLASHDLETWPATAGKTQLASNPNGSGNRGSSNARQLAPSTSGSAPNRGASSQAARRPMHTMARRARNDQGDQVRDEDVAVRAPATVAQSGGSNAARSADIGDGRGSGQGGGTQGMALHRPAPPVGVATPRTAAVALRAVVAQAAELVEVEVEAEAAMTSEGRARATHGRRSRVRLRPYPRRRRVRRGRRRPARTRMATARATRHDRRATPRQSSMATIRPLGRRTPPAREPLRHTPRPHRRPLPPFVAPASRNPPTPSPPAAATTTNPKTTKKAAAAASPAQHAEAISHYHRAISPSRTAPKNERPTGEIRR